VIRSVVCILVFCWSAITLNAQPLVKRTQVLMNTFVSISLPLSELKHSNAAFERLKKVELALSSYQKEAQIYRLNHEKNISISSDTYEALSLAKGYYEKTNGYFDITIGSITKGLFHFGEEESFPKLQALRAAKLNFRGLHFTSKQAWIEEGVVLDLGGMGKGFGVDKAVKLLKAKGIKEGVVALSGDIFCFHECEMAIQDPFSSHLLAEFSMAHKNSAISTSGNYRRYVKSKKFNHLINPKERVSQQNFASITLMSTHYSNSDLDAYATAVSVMPKEEAFRFLKQLGNVGYLVVDSDKELTMNVTFESLTTQLKLHQAQGAKKMKLIRSVPLSYMKR